jgi:hypothetical protein
MQHGVSTEPHVRSSDNDRRANDCGGPEVNVADRARLQVCGGHSKNRTPPYRGARHSRFRVLVARMAPQIHR